MKIKTLTAIMLIAYFPLFAQNYSLHFDGTDDEIRVTDTTNLAMTDHLTVEVWVKISDIAASGKNMIINREGEYQIGISGDGTVSWAFANTQPGWSWKSTNASVAVNQWTHLALTYDNGIVNVYINGVLEDSYTGSGSIGDVAPALNDFVVGWRSSNFDNKYRGYLDELRIWNTVLDVNDISTNWNKELTGTETGLVLYYKFDDTVAICDIPDCTNNLLNGTRNGANGANNLPIYTDSIPNITDVACSKPSCFAVSNQNIAKQDFKIWSNAGQLFVENQSGIAAHLQIVNPLGQVVFSKQMTTDFQNTLSINHLASGIYFIRLQNDAGQHVFTQKIWH